MNGLDERLGAIASAVLEAVSRIEAPRIADVGCDHGYLTAHLLQRCANLFVIASDVSAPSLEKARNLLGSKHMLDRAKLAVADGLSAIDAPVDAIVIAGMGASTILKIVEEGRERVGDALLIVQANTDLPLLRAGLAKLGFAVDQELFTRAAGRLYVTLIAHAGTCAMLDERSALLGTAVHGAKEAGQRAYWAWQRSVRVREAEQVAALRTERVMERMTQNMKELTWISEAMGMKTCCVADVVDMVNGIAPFELAEEWDNVGLLLGRTKAEVSRVLVALDLTQGVIEEAKALGAQLIVTHHPIMFGARKRITDADREGRMMLDMAQAGMAHIAAHTNLDAAPGGVNDTLMAAMDCENVTGEGCLRVGDLPEGTTLSMLADKARRRLKAVVRTYGAGDTVVRKLGCCSGAGSSEIADAVALGADCFITGEVKHNLALDAMDMNCCVIEAGHYETENPVCEVLRSALQNAADALQYKVTVFCSKENPFGR